MVNYSPSTKKVEVSVLEFLDWDLEVKKSDATNRENQIKLFQNRNKGN